MPYENRGNKESRSVYILDAPGDLAASGFGAASDWKYLDGNGASAERLRLAFSHSAKIEKNKDGA